MLSRQAAQAVNATISDAPSDLGVFIHPGAEWQKQRRQQLAQKVGQQGEETKATPRGGRGWVATPYVAALTFSETLSSTHGRAVIELFLYPEQLMELADGELISSGSRLYRHFRTGSFVVIKQATHPFFFGVVVRATTTDNVDAQGIRNLRVTLEVENFMYLFATSQLRFTPVKDVAGSQELSNLLSRLPSSAITQLGDYTKGFLQAVSNAISDTANASGGYTTLSNSDFLQQVIRALGDYVLPDSLGGGTLGESVQVISGSPADATSSGASRVRTFEGSEANVIKGNLIAKFQAYTMTNLSHLEIITGLFQPLPQIMELFPLVLPARARRQTRLEQAAGIHLVLVYRYRPCTPAYGPTQAGYEKMRKLTVKGTELHSFPSYCELFFGEGLDSSKYYSIDRRLVINLEMAWDDTSHLNATFCELPFAGSRAQDAFLIRAGVPLICDAEDITLRGMRCHSVANPVYPRQDKDGNTDFAQEDSAGAIAERIFHSAGMAGYFARGTFQLTHQDVNLRVGMWVQVAIPDTPITNSDSLLCYVTSLETKAMVDPQTGVVYRIQLVGFERGTKGVLIPVPADYGQSPGEEQRAEEEAADAEEQYQPGSAP